MKIKIDDMLTVEHEPVHVFEDGLDWWEIAPSSYVKEIVQALTAMGCEVFEWEGPDRSVGIEFGFIAFHFPHTEPDGTCPYMVENTRVITVPSCDEHEGMPWNRMTIRIPWRCPKCGQAFDPPRLGISYDGSLRLYGVHTWGVPCRHSYYYSDARRDAIKDQP